MSTVSHHSHNPHGARPNGHAGHGAHPNAVAHGSEERVDLLLIDDDPSDVFLVERMLDDSGLEISLSVADGLPAARRLLTRRTQCIIVDLSAPEGRDPIEELREVLSIARNAAVVVLTGLDDVRPATRLGVRAVAAGAADYLVKQEVDGPLLARAIRYAIERKRAEETERRLVEARIMGRENARLERGLLPVPLIDDPGLRHHTRYRPGRRRALLGGDFYDTVQTEGGAVHLMIGDVCGHGPDEAALGVQLRMAWRTLVLAGHTGEQLLGTLDTVLGHERRSEEIFTTLCMITIAPSLRTARMHLAGHPAPLLFRHNGAESEVVALPEYAHGPALGLVPSAEWPTTEIDLGESWSLMLYTDGLIEGRVGDGATRLGTDGLVELARKARGAGAAGRGLIDSLVTEVEDLNGDALTDDLAVLLLSRDDPAHSPAE
ncbi:PP2C family protein-serine/threonine phosphatase [Actinomadura rugatobispora]|uniref:PP2C family protein-serine/threonine phosphatase n=1 Tax=Actinomadura rugatobispora TaxID=1994 RepID=A0ABW1A1T4_9ACTN|nr:fused response regulator/phosphatase [Actinomadura rugatobispora]